MNVLTLRADVSTKYCGDLLGKAPNSRRHLLQMFRDELPAETSQGGSGGCQTGTSTPAVLVSAEATLWRLQQSPISSRGTVPKWCSIDGHRLPVQIFIVQIAPSLQISLNVDAPI